MMQKARYTHHPAIANRKIYFGTYSGALICLDYARAGFFMQEHLSHGNGIGRFQLANKLIDYS
jgi:hypothetical protein